jgi:peroxiredoxin
MLNVASLLLGLILVSLWMGFYALVKQQGRILLRLDRLENNARSAASVSESPAEQSDSEGLPVGTDFPSFNLPDLTGRMVSLEEFRGKRVLLVNWSFQCGYCDLIAPELLTLDSSLERANVAPIFLVSGDVGASAEEAAEDGLKYPILLVRDDEMPAPFAHRGTPVAYLLDEEGRVDAPFASGFDRVLGLAKAAADSGSDPLVAVATAADAPAHHHIKLPAFILRGEKIGLGQVLKRLTSTFGVKPCVGCERRASLLDRWMSFSGEIEDGLKAGDPAPIFHLPDLQGHVISLQQYRGRRVLLVFTDPQCGPCDELTAYLVRLHEEHTNNGLSVIVVARGDADENRRKAQRYGTQFPVVIQPKWNVSKEYRTFATPAAFLIKEDGTIAADPAKGTDSIVALARASASYAHKGVQGHFAPMLSPVHN